MNARIRKKQKTMAVKRARKRVGKVKQIYGEDSTQYQVAYFLYAARKLFDYDLEKVMKRMSKKISKITKRFIDIRDAILEIEEEKGEEDG